jgi:hypothetical protein
MRKDQSFENLINKDKYQVFLFYCPVSFPLNFAMHPWFVLNKKGILSRYEIKRTKNEKGYFYINNAPPFEGFPVIYLFFSNFLFKSNLLGKIEGDEDSSAFKAIEFIENSEKFYPYCKKYFLPGPNSNTYVQWVLDKFPEFNIKLNWRFIGKNYKI